MTIRKCDVCTKEVKKENDLRQINGAYRSDGLQEYCDDCHYKFEDYIQRLRTANAQKELDAGIVHLKAMKH